MKQFLFVIIVCITMNGYAQSEFNTKFKAIPPVNKPLKAKTLPPPTFDIPEIKKPNVLKNPILLPPKPDSGMPANFSMIKKNDFMNPGDVYRDKMTKDLDKTLHENDLPLLRKNLDFGQLKTTSAYLIVKYRDFGAIDGDMIRAYCNEKVIQNRLILDAPFREFKIILALGFNKIDFEALNRGSEGGNTAEIEIIDDKNKVVSHDYWNNLDTGFKASILIIKE